MLQSFAGFDLWIEPKAEILFAPTDDMMADGLTKAVDKTKFLKCRDYLLTKA